MRVEGSERPPFASIGVIGQSRYGDLGDALTLLRRAVEDYQVELLVEERLRELAPSLGTFEPGEVDLLVTLGGDGTLLRGARSVAAFHTPVLGINLGYLGFLTSVTSDELPDALAALFSGRYWLDTRFTLDAQVLGRDGSVQSSFVALNDAVLHKGGFARVVRLVVHVGPDHQEVAAYTADGIILATPTGSTAYSLGAGGPVVDPSVECILATPISPHTLGLRPLVLPLDTSIRVEPLFPTEELILTVDGRDGADLHPGESLLVRRGEPSVPLVRFAGQSFFDTLRRKLHWGLEHEERRRAGPAG
ncbi:MAG: NAD(+)/NADH kinase [Gemmatimonadota bacterium]